MAKRQEASTDTSAFYMELSKLEKNQEFDKALKICNKILNVTPKDDMAFQCKMVCLMQMSKFEDALRQIKDTHFDIDLLFEEAYCLYRLNKPELALETLENNGKGNKNSDRVKELKAQVYYRLEMYQESYDQYKDLLKNTSDDFELERLTNMQAAGVFVQSAPVTTDEDESYEMCYNKACQLLAREDWVNAEKALVKSEQMCKDFMKQEEADDDEIEQETGIIRVQIGFAIQMQGFRDRDAQTIYNSVLKSKPADIGLVAVASNNLVTLNKDQNIFDSKKKIKAATADGMEHKLTSVHRAAIARNNALLAMYTNQVDLCKTLINDLAGSFEKHYDQDNRDLIVAGVLARSGKVKESVDLLLKDKKDDIDRILIAAQVLLEKGDVSGSIAILEKLPSSVKHRTGLLSSMVALYCANDARPKAAQLLKEAVTSATKQKSANPEDMKLVWRKAAEFHLKGDEPSVAAKSLEELLKSDPKDKTTLAQLVLAYAKFDLGKAMEMSKRLPDFAGKVVDVDSLETAATLSKYGKKTVGLSSPKTQSPEQQKEAAELSKAKKKKKRKKKLPKNYNPNVDPDPYRWIAKKERPDFRQKRDKRKGKNEKFTGAQGNAAGQAETYDFSNKVDASKGATAKSPQVAAPASAGPRKSKPQPKGKKKGGKNRF